MSVITFQIEFFWGTLINSGLATHIRGILYKYLRFLQLLLSHARDLLLDSIIILITTPLSLETQMTMKGEGSEAIGGRCFVVRSQVNLKEGTYSSCAQKHQPSSYSQ